MIMTSWVEAVVWNAGEHISWLVEKLPKLGGRARVAWEAASAANDGDRLRRVRFVGRHASKVIENRVYGGSTK